MSLLGALTLACLAVAAYHHVGYPCLLALWSRLRPRPIARGDISPKVSLIVAAYDEASFIEAKIENCLALAYPQLEIVVVSDGSSDETPDLVEKYADRGVVGLHRPERRGKGAAINRAAEQASGEILVFTDANAFCAVDTLRQLIRNFADPTVGCVSGSKTVESVDTSGRKTSLGSSEGTYWRYESFLKRHESLTGSTVTVVGELMAVRRTLWKPIPKGVINDDAFLGLSVINAGSRVIYEPAARCEETASAHARSDRTRRQRMTAGRWQLLFHPDWLPWRRPAALFKLFSHKILRLLMPVVLICALACNLAALLFDPSPASWLLVTGAAQLGGLGLALVGAVLHATHLRWKPADVAFFVFNGNLGTFFGMLAFLRRRQSVLWDKVR